MVESLTSPVVVRTVGLTKVYGRVRALDQVDIEIGVGVTALLGPNGAGKTTFLKILATTLEQSGGAVEIFGLRSDLVPLALAREHLGYMPQEAGFYALFPVAAFLDYLAILKGINPKASREAEIEQALHAVGLQDVSKRRIRTLSGGMRRRLALAQALLGNPRLLLLDEPTVGLDPEQRLRFRELVSNAGEGSAVILATHQTEDVAALAERVLVIDRGRLVFDGSPESLAGLAEGRVWISERRAPRADVAWRTGDGRTRNIGEPPRRAVLADPSIEDGYLLLVGAQEANVDG